MSDNLADKLAELRAQGYTGEYPEQNWFTDINKGVQSANKKMIGINDKVQIIPLKPEDLEVQYTEVEQVARATVGGGQITVRDNPNLDLSGLNRDSARALTQETTYDFNYEFKTPFKSLNQFTGYAELVAKKSQDVEDYGFTTVVDERIDRGRSELEKGKAKLANFFQSLTGKLRNSSKGE